MSESLNVSQGSISPAPGRPWSREEIDAAIAGLDRATQAFSERVQAMRSRGARVAAPAPAAAPAAVAAPFAAAPAPVFAPAAVAPPSISPAAAGAERFAARDADLENRMQQAEQEAREYLERAKGRADSLVKTMIAAVERESEQIRREAEVGIRDRWHQVEVEAGRYLDDARQVAEGMVAERQERIQALSDEVLERGRALTAGMEDAERIQSQFRRFVERLSAAAAELASDGPAVTAEPAEVTELPARREVEQSDAVAA